MRKKDRGHIHLIIGTSRVGSFIATRHAHEGKYVTCIDKDPESRYKLGENFVGSFICGDATKISVLNEANIKAAREVIVVTDSDDINIYIATLARTRFGKKNVIVRIDDQDKLCLLPDKDLRVITPTENSLVQYEIFLKQEEEE